MAQGDSELGRLREVARRAAQGAAQASELAGFGDKLLLKLLRRADPETAHALLQLLGERAVTLAEPLLESKGPAQPVVAEATQLLAKAQPEHPLAQATRALSQLLAGEGRREPALERARQLSPRLRPAWAAHAVPELLAADTTRVAGLFVADPELARLLAEAVAASGRREAADWLAELAAQLSGGPALKAVKAAAWRLTQSGVEVRLPRQPQPAPSTAGERLIGLATPFDPEGERALWLIGPLGATSEAYLQAVVSDNRGVRRFELAQLRRGRREQLLDELRSDPRMAVVELPPAHVMALLEEAYFASPSGSDPRYASQRSELTRVLPPARLVPGATEAAASPLLESPLERLPEHPWLVAGALPAELAARLRELAEQRQESAIVLPDQQQRLRERERLAELLRSGLDAEQRARLRRRLEELALLFEHDRQPLEAAELATAARSLAPAEDADHHLLLALLERLLTPPEGQQGDGSGLILPGSGPLSGAGQDA